MDGTWSGLSRRPIDQAQARIDACQVLKTEIDALRRRKYIVKSQK